MDLTHLTREEVVGLECAPEVGQAQRLAHVATVLGRRHFLLRSADARAKHIGQLPIKGREPANWQQVSAFGFAKVYMAEYIMHMTRVLNHIEYTLYISSELGGPHI